MNKFLFVGLFLLVLLFAGCNTHSSEWDRKQCYSEGLGYIRSSFGNTITCVNISTGENVYFDYRYFELKETFVPVCLDCCDNKFVLLSDNQAKDFCVSNGYDSGWLSSLTCNKGVSCSKSVEDVEGNLRSVVDCVRPKNDDFEYYGVDCDV